MPERPQRLSAPAAVAAQRPVPWAGEAAVPCHQAEEPCPEEGPCREEAWLRWRPKMREGAGGGARGGRLLRGGGKEP